MSDAIYSETQHQLAFRRVEEPATVQLDVAISLLRRRHSREATVELLELIDRPDPHLVGGFVWLNTEAPEATEWGENNDSFFACHYRLPVGNQSPSILVALEAYGAIYEYFGLAPI
jgi:hypothetical protein